MKVEREALDHVAPVVRVLRSERFSDMISPGRSNSSRLGTSLAVWPLTGWQTLAKTKPKTARKATEEVLGQIREELLRVLGLDQLTREACLRGVRRPVQRSGAGRRRVDGDTSRARASLVIVISAPSLEFHGCRHLVLGADSLPESKMSHHGKFSFSSFGAFTGLDFAGQLRASLKGIAGLNFAHQLQSSMKAYQGVAGRDFAHQLQLSMRAYQGPAGRDFAHQLQLSMKAYQGPAGLDFVRQLQLSMKAYQGVAGLDPARQLHSSFKAYQGFAGFDVARRLQPSLKALQGFDFARQLQSSLQEHSLAGQLGIINLVSGLLGPTAALSAIGSVATSSFHIEKIASLLDKPEGLSDMDMGSESLGLEEAIFDHPAWSELASHLREWLKQHHVALLTFLIAAVHSQILFALSSNQADESEHRAHAASEELRERDEQHSHQLEELATSLERALDDLATLQLSLTKSRTEGVGQTRDSIKESAETSLNVERRIVRQTTSIYAHPRSKAAVVARVPTGESLFVFEHRRGWLYIGYSDIVTGRPITGWVRKKYTRRSATVGETFLLAPDAYN